MIKDCPTIKKEKNENNGNSNNKNKEWKVSCPKTIGKVFAMNEEDASRSKTMIEGNYVISNTPLVGIYDSGASHFFIAKCCMK